VVSTGLVSGYEALSVLLVIAGLGYVVRCRNPLFAGLCLGSAVGGGVLRVDLRHALVLRPDLGPTPGATVADRRRAGPGAYHQAPRFLLLGMPWSNLWSSPLIFCLAFWAALRSPDVLDVVAAAGTPDTPAGTRAARPATAIAIGSTVLVTAYFAAATLNGVWYALARPWLESGRAF
jgi:hypothetical protein